MASHHPLKVSSIQVRSDSLTIGPMHSHVLREKLRELEHKMATSMARLEAEAEEFRECHDMDEARNQDQYSELRARQQTQVDTELQDHQDTMDRLYGVFQREWANNPSTTAEPPHSCKLAPEPRYLASSLGLALQQGLAEIVLFRPPDPIDYLAHWLYRHSVETEYQKQKAIDSYMLKIAEDEEAVAQEKQKSMRREREHIRAEERRRKEIFMKRSKEAETEITSEPVTISTETPPETTVSQEDPNAPALKHELSMIAEREHSEDQDTGRLTDSAKLRLKEQEQTAEQETGQEEQENEQEDEQDMEHQQETEHEMNFAQEQNEPEQNTE